MAIEDSSSSANGKKKKRETLLIFPRHLLRENVLDAGVRIIVGTKFCILLPAHLCLILFLCHHSSFPVCGLLPLCSFCTQCDSNFSGCFLISVFLSVFLHWQSLVWHRSSSVSLACFYLVPSVMCLAAVPVTLSAPPAVLSLLSILPGPHLSFFPLPSLFSELSPSFSLLNWWTRSYCKSTVSCVCRQKLLKVGWKYFQGLISIQGMWPLIYTRLLPDTC